MGHRSIILLIGALLTFVTTNVMALGLGKIKLDSNLNQPLRAEIELFEVRDLSKEEIRVAIASREDFDRIGVDKVYFLSDLNFEVVLEGSGAPKVIVTSKKAVREPFLNFVVQVQWPSGKLLREYTLLMDLPVFSGEQSAPVQSATTSPSSTQTSSAQPSSDYHSRSSYQDAPARPSGGPVEPSYTGDTYAVESRDTLWEIAVAVRPDRSVSVHQTMIAIQRANPQAFINGNINLLKEGQILRIPDREEMAELGRGEAIREVATQNQAWSGEDQDVGEAQLSSARAYSDDDTASVEREGRLSLSSPDDIYESTEGRTSGQSGDSSAEALENELAITLEQLDKSNRENTDLRSKVDSLEEQISTMERMLEVSNENLRALELAAQKNAEEREAAIDEMPVEEESAADLVQAGMDEELETPTDEVADEGLSDESLTLDEGIADEVDEGLVDEDLAATDEVAEVEATAEPTPEPTAVPDRKKVVVSAPEPEKGIVDILLENIIYIVGGLVVVALGVFFLMRQKSSDEDDFDDFMQEHGLDTASAEGASEEQATEDTQLEDDIDLGSFTDTDEDYAPLDEVGEDLDEEVELEAPSDSEAQTEDVVAEADIYIAYGKYDQAEEMLLKALAEQPNDEEARLKLLEVYAAQGEVTRFDPHYAKLRAYATPALIERAESMRANIADAPEFDEDSFDTSDVTRIRSLETLAEEAPQQQESEMPSLDDDLASLDDDLAELDDATVDLSDAFESGGESEDLGLELDLGDLDSDGDPDAGLELELQEEASDASGDDLSLDIGEESTDENAELDLDFDLDLPDEGDETSLDLELDLPETAEEAPSDLDAGLDFDLEDAKATSEGSDELDLDLGDIDGLSEESLDADLDSLDADLDLSLGDDLDGDSGELSIDEAPAIEEPEASLDDLSIEDELTSEGDLGADLDLSLDELDSDLDSLSDLDSSEDDTLMRNAPDLDLDLDEVDASLDTTDDSSFDLESELAGIPEDDMDLGEELDLTPGAGVSGDTVINEALQDDYIEQKLSEDASFDLDLDDALPLEDVAEDPTPVLDEEVPEDEDLDLSSLDAELDNLTSELGDLDLDDSATAPLMDEPVTDFDDFESELELEEEQAETVKADSEPGKDVEEMGDDTMFDQAISEVPSAEGMDDLEFELPEVNPEDVGDDDLDFLSDSDETATKLDLARAYIDMGDQEGARDIIREVLGEGNEQQKSEAESLLARIDE